MFKRPRNTDSFEVEPKVADEAITPPHQSTEGGVHRKNPFRGASRPHFSGINPAGESGRRFVHPWYFFKICFRSSSYVSMVVNFLWPLVPAAIAVHFAIPEQHTVIFTLNYLAMIPAANLIGFAGQELARKLPKVFGVLLETTLGSVVEIVLFMALLVIGRHRQEQGVTEINANIPVIRAAILGSILANLLFCLGLCFIAGGLTRHEQVFHDVVSEVGNGLLLVAGVALILPAIFAMSIPTGSQTNEAGTILNPDVENPVLNISRATAVVLLIAFVVYVYFQMSSHHGLYDEVFERDEQKDKDRHEDEKKHKLTMTECIIALLIAIACVSLIAVFLVNEIEPIIHTGHVTDAFMGLILVPLVEKFAEHLTAIDEAFDNAANFALAHVLGACIQTALLNTPLVVLVAWGLDTPLDLNFKQFEAVMLILAIVIVGNFLRDGKSNYLEGTLCVFVYVLIAVAAFYYPNPDKEIEYERLEQSGSLEPAAAEGGEAAGGEGHGAMSEVAGEMMSTMLEASGAGEMISTMAASAAEATGEALTGMAEAAAETALELVRRYMVA